MIRIRIFLFVLLAFGPRLFAQGYQPTWASLDSRPIPPWFAEAKFGIFIHWGVYAVPAFRPVGKERYASYAEWYQAEVMHKPGDGQAFHEKNYGKGFPYRNFAPQFRAELWQPDQWAQLFKDAGAKYVILTSKHHDGFCLWPSSSPYSKGWNAVETGPRRDLVGDLTKAVRDKGLKMGLYFSLLEWETPTPSREKTPYLPEDVIRQHRIPADQYVDGHLVPQLKELVTRYQPAVIFSDGAWDETSDYWKSRDFLAWLYNNAPNKNEVVVNDRWGKDAHQAHGDYYTSEYGSEDENMKAAHVWEENQGIGGSYGLNRAENLADYKTSEEIIHILVDRVSRGGNLLLNVGPAADGTIPVVMQQRLLDIGAWLKVNGEAIYNTTAWHVPAAAAPKPAPAAGNVPVPPARKVFYTRKGGALYVLCTEWPAGGLTVPGLKAGPAVKAQLLGSARPAKVSAAAAGLRITPPALTLGEAPCRHAYVFKITGAGLPE